MKEKILIISGATATGKSKLALELADKQSAVIINADAMQLFFGLPILSAQPCFADFAAASHRLYSHVLPNQNSSVANWLELCKNEVLEAWKFDKLPILVGGTGLYISRLINGLCEIPQIEPHHRKKAEEIYDEIGHEEFRKQFGEEKIYDKKRLIRACEVFLQTQKPISFWQKQRTLKPFPAAEIVHFNLNLSREKIYQNCNSRFKKMLANGAIEEVIEFIAKFPDIEAGNFDIYQSSLKPEQNPALVYQGTPQRGDADISARKNYTGNPKDSDIPKLLETRTKSCFGISGDSAMLGRRHFGEKKVIPEIQRIPIYQSSLKLEQNPALVYQGTPQRGDADISARKNYTGNPKDSGIGSSFSITKTLGFAEIAEYLRGEINLSSLEEKVSQKTRNYAKRQLTWFRNQFDPSQIIFCQDAKEVSIYLKKL